MTNSIIDFLYPPENFPLDWHMVPAERCGLEAILERIKPKVAIEIGTYRGGSLELISKYADKVYSIDIDPRIQESIASRFENVEFLVGSSKDTLPQLLQDIENRNETLQFALVDGDHSEEGVRDDLNALLSYKPKSPMGIVMHDSFNPACRSGILSAGWDSNSHVQFLEVDFVCGQIVPYPNSPAFGEMWGGLAFAFLTPEKVSSPASKSQLYRYNYESAPRWLSEHRLKAR